MTLLSFGLVVKGAPVKISVPLSISSDYASDHGDPTTALKSIADAGFSHVHWVHHWNGDFIYSDHEIAQIRGLLRKFKLSLCGLHATDGVEKKWTSLKEYERLAGIELIENRIRMTRILGGDTITLHPPYVKENDPRLLKVVVDQSMRSLRALEKICMIFKVRIAFENMPFGYQTWGTIAKYLNEFGPDYVGLCYDAGHGNMVAGSMDCLEKMKNRLIAMHLHDNNGKKDQHKPIFSGKADWTRLASIIRSSAYSGPINMEVMVWNLPARFKKDKPFLKMTFETGLKFHKMVFC